MLNEFIPPKLVPNDFTSTKLPDSAALPSSSLNKIATHPLREKLYNELHNRPFQSIDSPAQLTHIAIQHQGKLKQEEHEIS